MNKVLSYDEFSAFIVSLVLFIEATLTLASFTQVDKALIASYHPGLGFSVTVKVKGKKHTLWLHGNKWYVEVRKCSSGCVMIF